MNSSSLAVASSFSPSPPLSIIPKCDVFISFRGPDTRNDFTSHLHAALWRKLIYTFIDNGLPKGDPISTLFPIIESSKFSVIIFSQHYASSKWCLNELVKIIECRKTRGQRVIPVFYNVDPSDVKHQTGSYAKSFAEKHEGKQTPETIEIWRNALREAGQLVGWSTADTRPDAVLTEKIVEDIWKKLNHMSSSNYNKNLVGIDSKIEVIESMLSLGSKDLCVVGIYGIGGIGKTTLAQATLDKILIEFQDAYFIDNIREKSKRLDGLSSLRKDLFSSLSEGIAKIGYVSNFTLARFCRKKVIIVFDDVSDPMQVEEIVGPLENWDNTGSRFIVTSRDKQVLQYLCDEGKRYKLSGLSDDEALQLFNRHAFKRESLIEKHMDLSKKVVNYTGGVPLAVKVLASYLCDRSEQVWKSALEKLEEIPHVKIQDVLKISYDGLEEDQKKLFLDIACFFQGESRDFLVEYYTGCGFKAEIELDILFDKCLIETSSERDVIQIKMHDMIQRMGREIVRQESNDDPGKRSRLWHHEDIKQVLTGKTGTEVIKGIALNMSRIDDINLKRDAFEKMKNLRLLMFYGTNRVHMPWGLDSILNELRYLRWDGFPLKSLQPNFNPSNLVDLDISESEIKQLWEGGQPLSNLRTIKLTECKELTAIPDPFNAQKLQDLFIWGCESLKGLPPCAHLKFLSSVKIVGCPKLEIIPELPSNLDVIWLYGTAIEELPSSIGHLSRLVFLEISSCPKLKSLPDDIGKLRSLQTFTIFRCEKLKRLPHDLGDLEALRELSVIQTAIEDLPSSICKLKCLKALKISSNKKLARLPHDIGDLESLKDLNASETAIEELPSSICKLKCLETLKIYDNKNLARLPHDFGDLESLQHLVAPDTAIEELPSSICKLKCLGLLYIFDNKNLARLPHDIGDLESLRRLLASHTIIEELPSSICKLKSLEELQVSGNKKLARLPHDIGYLESLQYLDASDTAIEELPSSICKLKRLERLKVFGNKRLARLPHDIGDLESLRHLDASDTAIEELPASICKLKSLKELQVSGNKKLARLPHDIGDLESLFDLDASDTAIEELPSSICKLKLLGLLKVSGNKKLARLPHDIGDLEFLFYLNASDTAIEELPSSICKLKSLMKLQVSGNKKLARLPHDIGDLESLKHLDASDTAIEELPSSICKLKCLEQLQVSGNKKLARLLHDIGDLESFRDLLASDIAIEELPSSIYKLKSLKAYVVYPGSKIPEWFGYQRIGSLITVELPLRSHNREIVGIAICVVVKLPWSKIGFHCKFEEEYDKCNVGTSSLVPKYQSLHEYDGYHMCIVYDPCQKFLSQLNKSLSQLKSITVSFEFYVERKESLEETVCFDVEACGVRFLYGQNLRKRNRGSSSVDEELGSPNKRVRGCTNEDDDESFSMVVDSLSSLEIK